MALSKTLIGLTGQFQQTNISSPSLNVFSSDSGTNYIPIDRNLVCKSIHQRKEDLLVPLMSLTDKSGL